MEKEYSWGRTQQGATRKDWENSEEQGVWGVIRIGNHEATIGDDDRGLEMHMRLESQVSSFFFILFALLTTFVQLANCDGDEEHTSPLIPTHWRTAVYSKKSTISSREIQTSVDKQHTGLETHFVSSPRYFFFLYFLSFSSFTTYFCTCLSKCFLTFHYF